MLTHDPGMYPKRLILDDARQFGIAVLAARRQRLRRRDWRVDAADSPAIRVSLREVKGISDSEIDRIVSGRPYTSCVTSGNAREFPARSPNAWS